MILIASMLQERGDFAENCCTPGQKNGTVGDCVTWPSPSISDVHAYS